MTLRLLLTSLCALALGCSCQEITKELQKTLTKCPSCQGKGGWSTTVPKINFQTGTIYEGTEYHSCSKCGGLGYGIDSLTGERIDSPAYNWYRSPNP